MKKIFIKRYGFLFTCFISYAIATSAQTSDLRLVDWSPKSQLVVKETKIIKPKYPVIDIHNHLRDLSKAEYYLKEMDKAGVWMCANLDGLSENDLYKENLSVYHAISRERFLVFFSPDFSRIDETGFGEKEAERLEEAVRMGARGLQIYKALGLTLKDKNGKLIRIDDPRIDPIWAKCGELGIPVMIHSSDPKAFHDGPVDKYNERYEELIANPAWAYFNTNIPSKEDLLDQRNRVIERHPNNLEKGFYPAKPSDQPEWVKEVGFGRQSVALTLENCYDDWCMSILAKELGKEDDYKYYLNRAYNYRNVFDTKSGFMRPKTADGKWIEPFDPIWSGGQGGRDFYTENNGWNYTWYVLHDPQGLINLMGGQEPFVAKLQQMFETNVPLYKKYDFLKQYPDMTGWIGMYSHGNEITWHIPYLYNYAGKPWMTQRRIRQILDLWYGDGPLGFCGDEDYGEMSSWYILSAMGFYTVAPGRPVYDIGSPLFEKSTIDIGDGKKFTIECRNISAQNKYIQSASMNGKELNRAWFTHEELMQGGTLLLNMGPRPNKGWATDIENLPVSLTPISSK